MDARRRSQAALHGRLGYLVDLVIFETGRVHDPQLAVGEASGDGFRLLHHARGFDQTIINSKNAADGRVHTE